MDKLTQREVTAFVGQNAGFYLKKWHGHLEGTGTETGFNWAAFFLGGLWLVHRKMYVGAVLFFGIIAFESLLEVSLGMPPVAWYLGTVVVSFVFGCCGNRWYFSRAQKVIGRVRSQRLPEDGALQTLATLGGSNSAGAWAFYFLIVVFVFGILEIRVDSVVGIGIGASSLLLCAVWFSAPPSRREPLCQMAGAGCVLAFVGVLFWQSASVAFRNRQLARMEEAQKQEVRQAALRRQETRARAAELGREMDAHWKQALALGTQGRHAEALEHWDRAIELHKQGAVELDKGETIGQLRLGRALALAQAGDHARATAAAAELATDLPVTGDSLYEQARVYSLSAGVMRTDARLAKAAQDQGAREYEARAVALLTRAQATGFFRTAANVDRLMSDPGLAPLRSQPAFKTFVKTPELGRLVAERCLDRALNLAEEGQMPLALLWFVRGLQEAPADAVDLERACRFNLAAWFRPESVPLVRLPHQGKVHAVAFANGGKTLVTICGVPPEDRSTVQLCVRHWDAGTGQEAARNFITTTSITNVALSANGKTFTVDNNEDRFQFWDSGTGAAIGRPVPKVSGRSYGRISLSQDGSLLFAQNSIWQVGSGRALNSKLNARFFQVLASSADAQILVVYVGNYDFLLLRLATGERVGAGFRQEGTGGFADVAALSADGSRVMTAGDTIVVRQAATAQPLGPAIPARNLRALGLSADGQSVASGGGLVPGYGKPAYFSYDSAQLWDVGTGKPTGPRLAHQGWVSAAVFSPDGSRLLTGSHDAIAGLWKVPRPIPGEVEQLVVWVELETDTSLDEHGEAHRLDSDGRNKRRKRLQELGGPPGLPQNAD